MEVAHLPAHSHLIILFKNENPSKLMNVQLTVINLVKFPCKYPSPCRTNHTQTNRMALLSFGRVAWVAIFVHKREERPFWWFNSPRGVDQNLYKLNTILLVTKYGNQFAGNKPKLFGKLL